MRTSLVEMQGGSVTELNALATFLQSFGAPGALILFVVGLQREWWVMGSQHREVKDELERVTGLYQRSIDANERRAQWLLRQKIGEIPGSATEQDGI